MVEGGADDDAAEEEEFEGPMPVVGREGGREGGRVGLCGLLVFVLFLVAG